MEELKEGDIVRRISASRTPAYYKNITSRGVVIKVGVFKVHVKWDSIKNIKMHSKKNLEKINI